MLTHHKLTILVPPVNKASLQACVSGPCIWHSPDTYALMQGTIERTKNQMSQHEKLALHHSIIQNPQQIQEAFRHHHEGYPTWMPVSHSDVIAWHVWGCKPFSILEAPFSIAACAPITPQLFAQHFKGHIDPYGWWHPEKAHTSTQNPALSGWAPLLRSLASVPSAPLGHTSTTLPSLTPAHQPSHLAFDINTYAPEHLDLSQVLAPHLATHYAVGLHTWKRSDSSAGWMFIGPEGAITTHHHPSSNAEQTPTKEQLIAQEHTLTQQLLRNAPDPQWASLDLWSINGT